MLRTLFVFLILTTALPSHAGNDFSSRNAGNWRGVGIQDDGQHWSIDLSISPKSPSVNYASVPCSGIWVVSTENSTRALVVEHITTGLDMCIDGSYVVLQETGEDLTARWYELDATVYAIAILQRDSAAIGTYNQLLDRTSEAIRQARAIDPPSTAMVNQLFGF